MLTHTGPTESKFPLQNDLVSLVITVVNNQKVTARLVLCPSAP
jgi:hypothetical protein